MKNQLWTQTILEAYNYIGCITRSIDKRVLTLGTNSYKTTNYGKDCTLDLMETIIELIERKKRILKLKLLVENTLRNLPLATSKLLIRKYLDKLTLCDLALENNTTVNIIRRKLRKAINECYNYFCKFGYCTSFIEQEYLAEQWLVGIYERKYKNQKKPQLADKVVFVPQKSNPSFSVCFAI